MRILIDCDVLLDVALGRAQHFVASAAVVDWAERHPGQAAVSWHTLANLNYLCQGGARELIRELLEFVVVPRVGTDRIRQALALPMRDLEDAMQVVCAEEFSAQAIVTRNLKDYANSPIRAASPKEIRHILP